MKIILAKSAGFCYGVKRAVDKAYELGKKSNENIYTFGPIIHNPNVVEDLENMNIKAVNTIEEFGELNKDSTVIIRSHGTKPENKEELISMGFDVCDMTCPNVKNIHKKVLEASKEGKEIIMLGDKNHPEVIGIVGCAKTKVHYITNDEELEQTNFNEKIEYVLVAQTTFNNNKYKDLIKKLQNIKIRVIIYNTICNATMKRQIEALELSKKVDCMIIIGGKNSSNSKKLYEICKKNCKKSYFIESINDLVLNNFGINDIIGITAGASTPKYIIEEVISNVRRNVKF